MCVWAGCVKIPEMPEADEGGNGREWAGMAGMGWNGLEWVGIVGMFGVEYI